MYDITWRPLHLSIGHQSRWQHNKQFSPKRPQRNRIRFLQTIKLKPTPKKGSEVEMHNTYIWRQTYMQDTDLEGNPQAEYNLFIYFLVSTVQAHSNQLKPCPMVIKQPAESVWKPCSFTARPWQQGCVHGAPGLLGTFTGLNAAGPCAPQSSAEAPLRGSARLSMPSPLINAGWNFIFIAG